MTQDQEENEQKYVHVYIMGVPEESFAYFKEIEQLYGDRVVAFQALLDSFDRERLIGELLVKLQRMEQRIEELESQKIEKKRTFGGL